jgi:hypothetical protein
MSESLPAVADAPKGLDCVDSGIGRGIGGSRGSLRAVSYQLSVLWRAALGAAVWILLSMPFCVGEADAVLATDGRYLMGDSDLLQPDLIRVVVGGHIRNDHLVANAEALQDLDRVH